MGGSPEGAGDVLEGLTMPSPRLLHRREGRSASEGEDIIDAIVLVGGRGTRLRPLTLTAAKPMLPTAGVPFLTHQLAHARASGVDHVVLATSYRAETFGAHFGDGSLHGVDIEYVTETEPMGTGGGIRNVADRLRGDGDSPVLVFNGDVLSGHDITAQLALHRDNDAAVTLYLTEVDDPRAFGCVPIDAGGHVTAFLEKMPEPVTNLINAGCYIFRRDVIDTIPTGRPVSVERETFPQLLASGATVMGYVDRADWLDLGTPAAFVQGSCDLVRGIAPSPALPGPIRRCRSCRSRGQRRRVGGCERWQLRQRRSCRRRARGDRRLCDLRRCRRRGGRALARERRRSRRQDRRRCRTRRSRHRRRRRHRCR